MKTILVVDDDPDNRYLLQQLLEANGYRVVTAATGVEALDRLREKHFDAIVSDIMMPRMDGFELCHNVKTDNQLRNLPFVFYTATYTDAQDEALALSLGADAFIAKPTEPEHFAAELQNVLRRTAQGPARQIAARLTDGQAAYLREYNTRLVRKLEDKVEEVNETNRKLQELNDTLEQRVTEKTRLLREANRELEAFAGAVAHDLRSPLRSICAFAGILARENVGRLSPAAAEHLERIEDTAARMERLIVDLLTYSRTLQTELKLEPVRLEPLIESALQSDPQWRVTRDRVTLDTPMLPVIANGIALNQCITNLISNAVKFQRPDTPLSVRIRTEEAGNCVRLWVEDNGIGISSGHAERIFRPFERLHSTNQFEGSGLGLAIVKKAVERMGGTVGVLSQPGEGSRFWIQLPRSFSYDPPQ